MTFRSKFMSNDALKLNCILLIDDDESTNVLHELILEEANIAEHILFFYNPQKALDYLNVCYQAHDTQQHPAPDLIFLDLNMPVMTGFEFMDAFKQFEYSKQVQPVIIVLTTSLLIDQYLENNVNQDIHAYKNKPLTLELLDDILLSFFENT